MLDHDTLSTLNTLLSWLLLMSALRRPRQPAGYRAEVLDDVIRAQLCPGKLCTAKWLQVSPPAATR